MSTIPAFDFELVGTLALQTHVQTFALQDANAAVQTLRRSYPDAPASDVFGMAVSYVGRRRSQRAFGSASKRAGHRTHAGAAVVT